MGLLVPAGSDRADQAGIGSSVITMGMSSSGQEPLPLKLFDGTAVFLERAFSWTRQIPFMPQAAFLEQLINVCVQFIFQFPVRAFFLIVQVAHLTAAMAEDYALVFSGPHVNNITTSRLSLSATTRPRPSTSLSSPSWSTSSLWPTRPGRQTIQCSTKSPPSWSSTSIKASLALRVENVE